MYVYANEKERDKGRDKTPAKLVIRIPLTLFAESQPIGWRGGGGGSQ